MLQAQKELTMMMARKSNVLSERHRKILKFLEEYQEKNGYSPSIREMGEEIGVKSTSLIKYYLEQLESMKYIERNDRVSRGIRILQKFGRDLLAIPVMGRIVAGEPIPVPASDSAYFDPETTVEIARSMISAKDKVDDLFALEVQGDSMIDAMVNDGDIVVMRRAQDAVNGEMVAVWLDDENTTTLKYFYKEKDRVRLQPANPTMEPIYVENAKHLRIMGKVVMVIRQVRSGMTPVSLAA
jgi:repressor LexA